MLDSFRIWPHIRARLRAGPLGPHLDGFVEVLQTEGYAPNMIRRYIRAADTLSRWLVQRRLTAPDLDEATVARFVAGLGRNWPRARPRGRRPETAGAVCRLVAWLWQQGVAARRAAAPTVTAADRWLHAFEAHLERGHGLSAGTRRIYLRYARLFVVARFGPAAPDWSGLTAEAVADFVRIYAARLKPSACRPPATATRALLRFLALRGAVPAGLAGAVPAVREWKLAALPRHLTSPEMERVLEGCGGATPGRRRDRAIVLLLARLGLRASEVAALHLADLDWPAGRLVIRAGKSGHARSLPLPDDVGQALVGYLRARRPSPADRGVFPRARPPYRTVTSSAVTALAQRLLRRAGVGPGRAGAHAFRHTAATQMVRRGATFKAVADVLGHARLQTTAIYAKLDVERLARVALPWPGGAP